MVGTELHEQSHLLTCDVSSGHFGSRPCPHTPRPADEDGLPTSPIELTYAPAKARFLACSTGHPVVSLTGHQSCRGQFMPKSSIRRPCWSLSERACNMGHGSDGGLDANTVSHFRHKSRLPADTNVGSPILRHTSTRAGVTQAAAKPTRASGPVGFRMPEANARRLYLAVIMSYRTAPENLTSREITIGCPRGARRLAIPCATRTRILT
jgi:hypothetical protein